MLPSPDLPIRIPFHSFVPWYCLWGGLLFSLVTYSVRTWCHVAEREREGWPHLRPRARPFMRMRENGSSPYPSSILNSFHISVDCMTALPYYTFTWRSMNIMVHNVINTLQVMPTFPLACATCGEVKGKGKKASSSRLHYRSEQHCCRSHQLLCN